ncbi:hypothetical protein COCNU_scaffold001528G000040 [Cocos nucifera]|nr:hypothetical protein [Cocos nucifera]
MEAKNTEVERKHPKKALEKVKASLKRTEAKLTLEKKRRVAQEKVAKAEKKVEGQIVKAGRLAVEVFRASKEFTNKKIKFIEEAFITEQKVCRQKVAGRFSKLTYPSWIRRTTPTKTSLN